MTTTVSEDLLATSHLNPREQTTPEMKITETMDNIQQTPLFMILYRVEMFYQEIIC
jgi:hypothetical protein